MSYVIVVVIQSKYSNQEEIDEASRVIKNSKDFYTAAKNFKRKTGTSSLSGVEEFMKSRVERKSQEK
jgi:hypothetical protein